MSKYLLHILLAITCLFVFSCKKRACPAYFTAYNIEPNAPDKFFNYYNPDTSKSVVVKKDTIPNSHRLVKFKKGDEPINDRMFESAGKNGNGLMDKKIGLLSKLFPKKKEDFMKVVDKKITISDLDSAGAEEMYAVYDSLFSPDRFKRDQYIYMELYGWDILEQMDSVKQAREELLAEDSLAGLSKKDRRKALRRQKKLEKKEKKRLKKLGIEPDDVNSDSTKNPTDRPDWLDELDENSDKEERKDSSDSKKRLKGEKPSLLGGKKDKKKKDKPKKEKKTKKEKPKKEEKKPKEKKPKEDKDKKEEKKDDEGGG
ncbi:MAG: hypothetical protein ACJAWV_002533 [Flammeovirgaceae bacterium]|jgi:hypothetical protein